MVEFIRSFGCLYIVLMTQGSSCICAFQNFQGLHLDLRAVTDVIINRTVILKCTGSASNESWYLKKGVDLLIDDGFVNSEYFHDGIHTNHTMETMYIEFMKFNRKYIDVYRCVREKGALSNSLDLNDIFRIESQQAVVICNNVTAARGARSVNLQCTIKYPGITCEDIFWENGMTGEIIDTTRELYEVSCEDSVNDSFVTTALNINTITDEVIKTNYYMVHVNRYQSAEHYIVHTTFNQDLSTKKSNKFVSSISIIVIASVVLVSIILIIGTVLLIWKKKKKRNRFDKGNYTADQPYESNPLGQNIENGIKTNEEHCLK